jgi:16S rRNA processing protein RimM
LSGNPEPKRRWVQVARILRPRGNKGEILAELLTDFPARFSHLKQIWLAKDDAEPLAVGLENFWVDRNHPETGIFHFAGCTTITDAERFRGFDVLLPFDERVKLPAGRYFVTDLIGCTVFEVVGEPPKLASPPCALEQAPRALGTVRDVFFLGEGVAGTPLLQVDTPKGELMIPLAEDICTGIRVAERRIEVRLPDGLSELNAPE